VSRDFLHILSRVRVEVQGDNGATAIFVGRSLRRGRLCPQKVDEKGKNGGIFGANVVKYAEGFGNVTE